MPTRIRKETTQRRVDAGGEELCKRLAVTTGTPVLNIERVGYVEDKAVMVKYSHWRHEFVPGLEDETVHIPDLVYAIIVEQFQVPVVRAEET